MRFDRINLQTEPQPGQSLAVGMRKRKDIMIKTQTGAQRYNARMSKLFDEAMRLKKHYDSITVVIDVRGGVAEVVNKPENIRVIIRDWDNIES